MIKNYLLAISLILNLILVGLIALYTYQDEFFAYESRLNQEASHEK